MTRARLGRPKRSKTWNLKSKLIPAIRKIWLYSPLRKEVLTNAKVNGRFKCNICKDLFDKVHVDHIKPIVSLKEGFTDDWNEYINNTFCDIHNLQAICENCHSAKTLTERELRKKYKAKRKNKNEK